MDEYAEIEQLKLRLLQSRLTQSYIDISEGKNADGESFFDELEKGDFN